MDRTALKETNLIVRASPMETKDTHFGVQSLNLGAKVDFAAGKFSGSAMSPRTGLNFYGL